MPFGGLVLGPVPVGLPDSSCKPDGLAHLLGNHQDAESFFRSALSIHERLEAPYLIALSKLDYAGWRRIRMQEAFVLRNGEPGLRSGCIAAMRPSARYARVRVVPSERTSHRSARIEAAAARAARSRSVPESSATLPKLTIRLSALTWSWLGPSFLIVQAPSSRSDTWTSSVEPLPTTVITISPRSTSAMFIENSRIPDAKCRVPQIGSTSQYDPPGVA